MMVRWRVVLSRQVAGRADGVALSAQLAAVRIVAVAARDAARIHLALQERTPDVHFVALLAIGVVERAGEQRGAIVIEKRFAGRVSFGDLAAPRMALRADFDLALGCARLRARALPVVALVIPRDTAAFVEARGQTLDR